jgi:hypothetical protein
VVGEVAGGVLAYTQKAGYQERIELSIRWSVQRYYSQEVTNTTAIDAIQQGVSTRPLLFYVVFYKDVLIINAIFL